MSVRGAAVTAVAWTCQTVAPSTDQIILLGLKKSGVQVAGQAVPITKEVTSGVVRPGGKEVARIADKYSDDATRGKVQVRFAPAFPSTSGGARCMGAAFVLVLWQGWSLDTVAVQGMARDSQNELCL